jgi:hypothetical protein
MNRSTIQAEAAGASTAGGLFVGGVFRHPVLGLAFGLGLGLVLAYALRPTTAA